MKVGKINRGKQFEEQVSNALESVDGVGVVRLFDPTAGYAGVANICDYIVYRFPKMYAIECKSCYGNTLSINSNDPKRKYGDISNTQWEGMLKISSVPGVVAGVMVWFIDHDKTFFVPIQELQAIKDSGAKSLNITKQDTSKWFLVDGKKKRVLMDYDFESFFNFFEKSC